MSKTTASLGPFSSNPQLRLNAGGSSVFSPSQVALTRPAGWTYLRAAPHEDERASREMFISRHARGPESPTLRKRSKRSLDQRQLRTIVALPALVCRWGPQEVDVVGDVFVTGSASTSSSRRLQDFRRGLAGSPPNGEESLKYQLSQADRHIVDGCSRTIGRVHD